MASGAKLFVVIGLPIIGCILAFMVAMYFLFPQTFREWFPCFTQLKPDTKIVKVVEPVPVPVIIDPSGGDNDKPTETPPSYSTA